MADADFDDEMYETMMMEQQMGGAGGNAQIKEMVKQGMVDRDFYNDFTNCFDESDMATAASSAGTTSKSD